MLIVAVCEQFGWDYHTYLSQPVWFLDLIHHKLMVDAKKAKEEEQRIKSNR